MLCERHASTQHLGCFPAAPRPASALRCIPLTSTVQQTVDRSVDPHVLTTVSGAQCFLFGVDHEDIRPDIGSFILEHRPQLVFVETALTPQHGCSTGAQLVVPGHGGQQGMDAWWNSGGMAGYLQLFLQLAYQLQRLQDDLPAKLSAWQAITAGSGLVAEQLTYIAALAVEAPLIYCDRPKADTYRRLFDHTTIVDLDHAFGRASWRNYQELLTCLPPAIDRNQSCSVHRIMTDERDAVMASCIRKALAHVQPTNRCSVAVVGNDHVPGILAQWARPTNQHEMSTDNDTAMIDSTQHATHDNDVHIGVRRALLESMLRLQTQPAVLEDVEAVLGPVADTHYEYYGATYELYGTTQMLLACLGRDELRRVCGSWRCDMWEVLGPVRAARPVSGGLGYAPDLTLSLRQRATVPILL